MQTVADPRKRSELERIAETYIKQLELPEPHIEHRFHHQRRWRFDYCWDAPYMIALEIEGGVYSEGRHTRGAGFEKDIEKYNNAAFLGWKVFRLSTNTIHEMEQWDLIKAALDRVQL